MQRVATTRMSSKGQVVIPESVRNRLHLEAGDQFLVLAEKDVVILKTIQSPAMDQFDGLVRKARQQARTCGLKPKDIENAVARARGRG
ncbi:MAG: AbrB/MazE/SpoVT family DNA-binding domain-containing protein [Kiritimatiellae bacterium]|nr:AbrB/MazE/SpoVT family DNA-binding domain-containing protein [Kiritimatiellia bacterium]